jgi:hypothetical protein
VEDVVKRNPLKIAAGAMILAAVAAFGGMAPQLYRYLRIRRM